MEELENILNNEDDLIRSTEKYLSGEAGPDDIFCGGAGMVESEFIDDARWKVYRPFRPRANWNTL